VRLRSVFTEVEIQADDRWPPVAGDFTVVVNATPIRDEVLVDVNERQTVVDLAYNAGGEPTALAAAARERECATVDGLDVLVAQGAASFERWTGVPAPVDVMRAAITLGA
jgi:shikimate dehydrogenase